MDGTRYDGTMPQPPPKCPYMPPMPPERPERLAFWRTWLRARKNLFAALPRNPLGKVMRNVLREQVESRE